MTLYIATNNAHKVGELKALFPGIDLAIPRAAGIEFDYEENGETFLDNSLGKARALHFRLKAPVLADDSGLCVDALGGAPGVKSARYGSLDGGATKLSTSDRNALLLKSMRGKANRSCRFVCAMSLVLSEDRFFVAQETCEGQLLEEPRGEGGFGYDPIFLLPEFGLSMAELNAGQKNELSHRGRAAARIRSILTSFHV